MYNERLQARRYLLDCLQAFKICYPSDFCRQVRALLEVLPKVENRLGFDIRPEIRKTYDMVQGGLIIARTRALLENPRHYLITRGNSGSKQFLDSFLSLKVKKR